MLCVAAAGVIAIALDRLAVRRSMTGHEQPDEGTSRIGGASWEGIRDVARSPYLMSIAIYVGLFTVLSTFLYFEKARIIDGLAADTDARTQLFAGIELGGQSATILLQLFITGRLMRLLGVGTLLAVVPAVTVIGFIGLAAAPSLVVIALFEASRRASNHALSKPARETLYTVVPRSDKYKAKSFIDTFVYRGGDALGTLADRGIAAIGVTVAWVAVPLAAGALLLSFWLGRREELTPEAIAHLPPDPATTKPLADAPSAMAGSTP